MAVIINENTTPQEENTAGYVAVANDKGEFPLTPVGVTTTYDAGVTAIAGPGTIAENGLSQDAGETTTASTSAEPVIVHTNEEDKGEANETEVETGETSDGEEAVASEETDGELSETSTLYEEDVADFEVLKKLPYIDLYSKCSEAKHNIEDLKSSKEMMDQIGDLSDEQYAAKVAQMDEAQRQKYEGSVKDFYAKYPRMMTQARRVKALLEKMVAIFPQELVGSTAFISKSMVESATIRLENLKNANPVPINQKMLVKRMEETMAAYADRTNFDVLFHKLRYPNQTLEIYKQFIKDGPEESMKYIDKVFMPVFNDKYMTRFRKSFTEQVMLAKEDPEKVNKNVIDVMVFFMTYWLAKTYEKEYQNGKCAVAKVFVMNIYDMDPSSGIYDLPGGSEYMINVGYTIYMILMVSTGGQFSEKQMHKKINAIIDDLLRILEAAKKDCTERNPGKNLDEINTVLETVFPDANVDNLIELDERGEECSDADPSVEATPEDAENGGEDDGEDAEPEEGDDAEPEEDGEPEDDSEDGDDAEPEVRVLESRNDPNRPPIEDDETVPASNFDAAKPEDPDTIPDTVPDTEPARRNIAN
jgi:hypothetical protein